MFLRNSSPYSAVLKNVKQAWLAAFFVLVSCLAYSSTVKIEATCFSEKWVDFSRTIRRYFLEDVTLHSHLCDSIESVWVSGFSVKRFLSCKNKY
jgi:hypothetical protein